MSCPEPISNFETIQTLYNRLKADETSKYILFHPEPRYGLIKFVGAKGQTHTVVEADAEWTHMNFLKSNTPTPIETILNILKPLIEKHGSKPVLHCSELIETGTSQVVYHQINVKRDLSFYSTDMNPYSNFSLEYEKVRQLMGCELDIVHAWLKKKCPKDVEVFFVETLICVGSQDLLDIYSPLSAHSDWKSLFFNQDLTNPSIYTCKFSAQNLSIVCGGCVDNRVMKEFVKTMECIDLSKSKAVTQHDDE